MEGSVKYGDPETFTVRWYHIFLLITFIPGVLMMLLGSGVLMLADALLLNTHHFNISVKPKKLVKR